MRPSSIPTGKQFNSPGGLYESINSSLRSPQSQQIQTKRKEQPANSSYGHISAVRTQLSLEKKKVQDLNKCVKDYQNLKQNSETKLNASIEELRSYKDDLLKSQKEIKNYEYKLEYLEKEKARLENQNKQLKAYIQKLETSLKAAQKRRESTNSPFNHTSTNINQTFSNDNFNSNNTNVNGQHNISSQNLNVSSISQSNAPNTNLNQYVKKLENDIKNYQSEIKILTSALEINSPKVSIKRGLDQSIEQQHQKSVVNLIKELAECKEVIQQNEDVETGLREKIQEMNQQLEKGMIQIEENKIIKENDNDEIMKLENENKGLRHQVKELQQSQQTLTNQLNQSINQTHQTQQSQLQLLQATDRLNTPKQSIIESKLQSSFQLNQGQSFLNDNKNIHNMSNQQIMGNQQNNISSPQHNHHSQSQSSYDNKNDQLDILHKQKETIRDLTEQISQIQGQLTEFNFNAYSEQQKLGKQIEELREVIRSKEEVQQDQLVKIKELMVEIESLKQKIERQKEKRNKHKQEIEILKSDQAQLDQLNQKLNQRLKSIIEESSSFKDQVFMSLKLNSKNYQLPRTADVIVEEVKYLQLESKQIKQALEEAVNKYAQQIHLNKDLKNTIQSFEKQIERQAESKTQVQATLAQQIYNLRSQNTDLQDINSTIRRECAMFMDSLQAKHTKTTKKSKSLKKSKSTKQINN